MKERKDTFEMPVIPKVEIPKLREGVTMRDHSGGAGTIRRGSVKRQSEIMREKKKSRQEEREEEKQRQASYFRKVTGKFFTPKIHETSSSHIYIYSLGDALCFRSEKSEGATDGLFLWWLLKMFQNRQIL